MVRKTNIYNYLASPLIGYSFATDTLRSQELYDHAKHILEQLPRQGDHRQYNDENQVIIELPMDYSFELQRDIYQEDMANMSPEMRTAKSLLEESSALNHVDASYLLADMNLYGNYSYPKNGTLALNYYKKVTELSPNSTAYFTLGFIYSTGLFGEVEQNQAKANLYYQHAFDMGDLRAGMVLGYRHLHGISVPMDCGYALYYYRYVANQLFDFIKEGPLGGPLIDSFSIRIADFQGGLYGKNVGESPTSLHRKASRYDEILMGSQINAQEAYYAAIYLRVLNYYEGSYVKPKNLTRAFKLALHATEKGLKELDMLSKLETNYLARSIQRVGHMYLRGEGVEQNFDEALAYFKKSLEVHPQPATSNDLGLLYEFGPDHLRNLSKAKEYYNKAANAAVPNGLYNFGRVLKSSGNAKGFESIQKAAFSGDTQAIFEYAQILENAEDFDSCDRTVTSYKVFSEKIEPAVSSLEWAFNELISGRSENALIGYSMAAEQGYETAQSSAAYLLYQPPNFAEEPPSIPPERKEMALVYLTRSSSQFNVDSTVLMGDLYFSEKSYHKAVTCYEAASSRLSSHASWNLGWMYENGHGVEQDFHLAKRYYDLSLLGHPKAYLPVQLSLLKLRLRSFINNITGGKINSIDDNKEQRTWADWKALYQKVRSTSYTFFDNEDATTEQNSLDDIRAGSNSNAESDIRSEEGLDDLDNVLENEDFVVLLFFLIVFLVFFLLHIYQQRQLRQRRQNGEAPANFEFNFRVIAI